jgi:tetratricopeptide (TPR) repeat protein
MFDQLRIVDELLKRRQIKRAEMLINRQMRRKNGGQHALWLIQRARTRLMTGRPAAALDDLLRAQILQPELFTHVINLQILADSYFARFESSTVGFVERGDAQIAENLYQQMIEKFPNHENIGWAYYQRGRLFLASDRVQDAVTAFKIAAEKPSVSTPSLTAYCYERLAFVYFYEDRQFTQALTAINKAIVEYPASEDPAWLVQAHLFKSRILRGAGEISAALDSARIALTAAERTANSSQSPLPEALFAFGEILSLIDGQEKAAVQTLERFLEISRRPVGIDVTWARVHELLGDLYFKVGNFEASVVAYSSVLQLNPHYPWEVEIYQRIARAYYRLGQYEKVLEILDYSRNIASNDDHDIDYPFYNLYGAACLALKRFDQAAANFEKALELASSHSLIAEKMRQYRDMAINRQPINTIDIR